MRRCPPGPDAAGPRRSWPHPVRRRRRGAASSARPSHSAPAWIVTCWFDGRAPPGAGRASPSADVIRAGRCDAAGRCAGRARSASSCQTGESVTSSVTARGFAGEPAALVDRDDVQEALDDEGEPLAVGGEHRPVVTSGGERPERHRLDVLAGGAGARRRTAAGWCLRGTAWRTASPRRARSFGRRRPAHPARLEQRRRELANLTRAEVEHPGDAVLVLVRDLLAVRGEPRRGLCPGQRGELGVGAGGEVVKPEVSGAVPIACVEQLRRRPARSPDPS